MVGNIYFSQSSVGVALFTFLVTQWYYSWLPSEVPIFCCPHNPGNCSEGFNRRKLGQPVLSHLPWIHPAQVLQGQAQVLTDDDLDHKSTRGF